jgi:hypothetical protein
VAAKLPKTHDYSLAVEHHCPYTQGFQECKSAIGNRSIENGAELVGIVSVQEAVFEQLG